MSRQWTREECRNLFLDYLWGAVDEWEKIYHDRDPDCTVRPTRADVSWGKRSSQFDLSDDTFSRRSRVHDWRNHVAEEVEAQWQHLTSRERLLVAVMANEPAENEEWD